MKRTKTKMSNEGIVITKVVLKIRMDMEINLDLNGSVRKNDLALSFNFK